MILGDVCTRNCGYCAVAHGTPVVGGPRGARADRARGGRAGGSSYVVITSVNRDDLADGGAAHWAATIRAVRAHAPACRVEVLIPDFQGGRGVARHRDRGGAGHPQPQHRDGAAALQGGAPRRPLRRGCSTCSGTRGPSRPALPLKSGIILGLGEERDELVATLRDLREVGVSILTLGQYLRPSAAHLPVARYYHPDEFAELAATAARWASPTSRPGPLVRSSYHAKTAGRTARGAGAEPWNTCRILMVFAFAAAVAGALLVHPAR